MLSYVLFHTVEAGRSSIGGGSFIIGDGTLSQGVTMIKILLSIIMRAGGEPLWTSSLSGDIPMFSVQALREGGGGAPSKRL